MQAPLNRMLNPLGRAIGAGLGSGLSPLAPGTAGSLAALILYYLLTRAFPDPTAQQGLLAAMILVGLPLGVWATGLLVTATDQDPGRAVWDEFVGMWITCLLLPPTWYWLAAAFFAFRFFDVVKPWPARQLERLPGGWGIMADDVAAGLYGAALLNGARLVIEYLG